MNFHPLMAGAPFKPRRVKRVEVSLRTLRDMFTTGYRPRHYEITEGIPKDAVVIGAEVEPSTERLVPYVEHESFPEIPLEGFVVDSLYITATLTSFEHCQWGELPGTKP